MLSRDGHTELRVHCILNVAISNDLGWPSDTSLQH